MSEATIIADCDVYVGTRLELVRDVRATNTRLLSFLQRVPAFETSNVTTDPELKLKWVNFVGILVKQHGFPFLALENPRVPFDFYDDIVLLLPLLLTEIDNDINELLADLT